MKRISYLTAAGLLSLSSVAEAQTFLLTDNTRTIAESYLSCVVSEATKLDGAGESVSQTVEFAKSACSDHKLKVAVAIMSDVTTKLPKQSAQTQINVAQGLRESVFQQVTQEAGLRLARLRSERVNAANK